jgi:two-component system sensor kinase FixL
MEDAWAPGSLQRLMTHTSAGIIVLDEHDRIAGISPLAAGLFRRTPTELTGLAVEDLGRCKPSLGDNQVREHLAAGRSVGVLLELTHDGKESDWIAGELEIIAHSGVHTRVLMVRDVTDRVRGQHRAAYRQAHVQYLSRYHAMGDMAMILVHELGQPLAASRNYVSAMRARLSRSGQVDEIHRGLDRIESQLGRAADIVASARRYVRKIESTTVLVDLDEIVTESLYFVRLRAEDLGVRVSSPRPGGPVLVRGESELIGQVITNICVNALDEIALPSTEVKHLVVQTGVHDGRACVSVRDLGRGMGVLAKHRLASGAFSGGRDAAGVGLIISEHIVDRHGGRIEYRPNTPRGTEVRILLPLASPD